jgi:hypothetical protein
MPPLYDHSRWDGDSSNPSNPSTAIQQDPSTRPDQMNALPHWGGIEGSKTTGSVAPWDITVDKQDI